MKIGDTFSSWQEFEEKLTEYRNSTFQPLFTIKQVKTIETVNQTSKGPVKLKPELKYANADIQCVHFGEYQTVAKEVSNSIFCFMINIYFAWTYSCLLINNRLAPLKINAFNYDYYKIYLKLVHYIN
jgi:hypothetical protein